MGRTDDIINVAGHRLSTGGMEEVLASHPAVAECAVVGIRDALKGEQPCGFVVLKAGATVTPEQVEKMKQEAGIYMVGDSRLNIAGLNRDSIPVLARAIVEAGV